MKKKRKKGSNHRESALLNERDIPFSFEESYKTLRTNLEFMSSANQYKKLLVTSSLEAEGKTTVTLNLGLVLSETEKKVIVVDCDLRKSGISQYLRLKESPRGLSTLLCGRCSLDDCLFTVPGSNLIVLGAGPAPPNPSELLVGTQMKKLVSELEQQFDYIIFDAPPVTAVTDAAALGKLADGALLVVKHKSTALNLVQHSIDSLQKSGTKIIGAVLNNVDFQKASAYQPYGYYSYGYGYGEGGKN